MNDKIGISGKLKIYAVVKHKDGTIDTYQGSNLITNEGDKYYAQKIAGVATDFDTPGFRLGIDNTDPTKNDTDVITLLPGSEILISTQYPEVNNTDAHNPDGGENVVTWVINYPEGQLNSDQIIEGAIVDDKDNPTKAINRFLFAGTVTVTDTDSLTVYINHELVGV